MHPSVLLDPPFDGELRCYFLTSVWYYGLFGTRGPRLLDSIGMTNGAYSFTEYIVGYVNSSSGISHSKFVF